ncbi:dienelactone hydrolase family protein [Colwellia sp. 6_MG-2023]|uniref:dienelactone hydrolase family protein n=1 Tax=Colwellia sp. 6_MG-2023 TaxID=3062676 RepID=UPI0026E1552D|nr:dienelactone hydrolase family protein [Colwellia sp. 6_MG-2023]MDO6487126.1 dienelactone hydrolase family protein [Colwellia sp. 6_MG-2023]
MTTNNDNNKENATIPQEAFDWYDEYAHGIIDRRTFMKRLAGLAVVGMSTNILASALLPNYAQAEQVSFNDKDITASYETFESPLGLGSVQGYFVKPANLSGTAPAVLVVHENRGLNPYIKDVARRVAKAGFIAFAPDILHTLGGYPGNDDEGRTMQRTLDRAKVEQDFIASAKYLKNHQLSNGKLGGVGFCFGGYIINMLAARAPDVINAGVPFYGTPAAKELRKNITAPLMIQLAELDKRVNATWDEYEQDLKASNIDYVMHMYKNANHGFHNDSTSRYLQKSADLAWERTITFFNKHLSTAQ